MQKTIEFDVKEVGTVLEVKKIIARVKGLPTCAYGQPLVLAGKGRGMVIGFNKKDVLALLFEGGDDLKAGDSVVARTESLSVPVGEAFLGRIVNGLGRPCDGRGKVSEDAFLPVFGEAPGIMDRVALTRQVYTGTKILDAVIPIAKGQRELIIGDRVTGKTTLAIDAFLNQKDKDVVCIYCYVGRSYNSLLKLAQLLQEKGAMSYSVIVASLADAAVGEQFLAPYTAAALGEFFMRQGRDVLVVFDDLTKHAWAYRQISLLMDRPPGREAYPGDIFYIHSQLMERAAQLKPELGGGSMTFLPIVETQQGDVTGYISSNLISMTDGQIYTSSELFQEGFKPAVDLGLSVSRIGNKIQCAPMRALCASLRLEYVQYKELLNMTKLRSSISKEAQVRLKHGQAITEILKQDKNEPVNLLEQIILFFALRQGVLDELPKELMQAFRKSFYGYLRDTHPDVFHQFDEDLIITESFKQQMRPILLQFISERLGAPSREAIEV